MKTARATESVRCCERRILTIGSLHGANMAESLQLKHRAFPSETAPFVLTPERLPERRHEKARSVLNLVDRGEQWRRYHPGPPRAGNLTRRPVPRNELNVLLPSGRSRRFAP